MTNWMWLEYTSKNRYRPDDNRPITVRKSIGLSGCPSVDLSLFLSVYVFALFVSVSVYVRGFDGLSLRVCPLIWNICKVVCLPISLCMHVYVCQEDCLSSYRPISLYVSVYISICMCLCVCLDLYVCMCLCVSVCLPISLCPHVSVCLPVFRPTV